MENPLKTLEKDPGLSTYDETDFGKVEQWLKRQAKLEEALRELAEKADSFLMAICDKGAVCSTWIDTKGQRLALGEALTKAKALLEKEKGD